MNFREQNQKGNEMEEIESQEQEKILKLSDFPKNRENPFLNRFITELDPTQRRKMVAPSNKEVIQTVVDQDGVMTGQSAFVQYMEVDEKQFAKLYLSNLAAFWDLSKPAIRVFTYIMANIRPNQDKIEFDLEECMDYTQYRAKKAVFQGLADLLTKNIIARGRNEYQYFINPMITFNGDRVLFAKGIIRKKIKTTANDQQLTLFGNIDNSSLNRLKKIDGHIKTWEEPTPFEKAKQVGGALFKENPADEH